MNNIYSFRQMRFLMGDIAKGFAILAVVLFYINYNFLNCCR